VFTPTHMYRSDGALNYIQVAASGLLSKAEAAGFTVADLEPVLAVRGWLFFSVAMRCVPLSPVSVSVSGFFDCGAYRTQLPPYLIYSNVFVHTSIKFFSVSYPFLLAFL